MATDKPITGFDPLDVADVEQDDILVVVDVHDTDQSGSGSTKTLTLAALFGSMVDAVLSGILTFTAAVSKIIPGATSFAIRNHADSADNVLVTDDGSVTVLTKVTVTGVGGSDALTLTNGNLTVANGDITSASTVTASGDATGNVIMPHRTTPGLPANGAFWTTTSGAFVRINGVTKTITLT